MAIDLGTMTTSIKERTCRIEIQCGVGEDPVLRIYREKVWIDGDTVVRREEAPTVVRSYSEIAAQDFDGLSGSDLYARISGIADALRKEDMNRG